MTPPVPAPCSRPVLAATLALFVLAGCSSLGGLGGLGGSAEFKCSAPKGVPCLSVSGVSANHRAGTLPVQTTPPPAEAPQRSEGPAAPAVPGPSAVGDGVQPDVGSASPPQAPRRYIAADAQAAPAPLGAIRSEPTLIRIWVAPWEDTDGDLHDQAYIYLQIDAGRWLIEHNRAQIQRAFGPQVSLSGAGPKSAASAARPSAGRPSTPDGKDMAAAAAQGAAMAEQILRGARLPQAQP